MHHGQAKEIFDFVLEKVMIAGEEETGWKKEDAIVKTGDRQVEDLHKAKEMQIHWKSSEDISICG